MIDLRKAAQAVIDMLNKDDYARTCHENNKIEALRQALAEPDPSVDALIAEAVAKEREACAQIGEAFDKERPQSNYGRVIAVSIRARGQAKPHSGKTTYNWSQEKISEMMANDDGRDLGPDDQ